MAQISLKSFSKINLSLKIIGLRPDGFHEIETLMQTISLCDDMTISDVEKDIIIECNNSGVPTGPKNICYKAADVLKKKFNVKKGAKISIKKNIPMEAGLGGGSSNGATVLNALNILWDLGLSKEQLIFFASQIGSDVPFFIEGGRAVCRGRGEEIEKIPNPKPQIPSKIQNSNGQNEIRYIIVKPDVSVPTRWAYGEWDKVCGQLPDASAPEKTLTGYWSPATGYFNDLESVVISKYPIIGKVSEELITAGCLYAQMTGSGSAVFGIAEDEVSGRKIYEKMRAKYPNTFLSHNVDSGSLIGTESTNRACLQGR